MQNPHQKKHKLFDKLVTTEMELQKLRKQNKYFEESKAVGSIQENPKYFFSYAKRKSKIKTKVGPLLKKKQRGNDSKQPRDGRHTSGPV